MTRRSHWETKGRFCRRVVLANVPSFRLSFRGNMRMYPRSGFRSGGTSECTLVPVVVPGAFWKTTLLSTPEEGGCESKRGHSTKALHAILCGFLRKVGLFCKPYSRGLPKGVPGRGVPVMKCIKCIVTLPHFATLL